VSTRTFTHPPELQELDVRSFRIQLYEDGEAQRNALYVKRGRRVPDPRVRSRRRERGVREHTGAGSAPRGSG